MMAAVMICGMILGIKATSTIRLLLNIQAMKNAMSTMARAKEVNRLNTRYCVPLKKMMLEPVTFTLYLYEGKYFPAISYSLFYFSCIRLVPISFTRKLKRTFWKAESTKELLAPPMLPVDWEAYFRMKFLVMFVGNL